LLYQDGIDTIVWKEDRSGSKNRLRIVGENLGDEDELQMAWNWKGVCNARVPPKVQDLVLRIPRRFIPTQKRLNECHVPCSSSCAFFVGLEEIEWHLIFQCENSVPCWDAAGL